MRNKLKERAEEAAMECAQKVIAPYRSQINNSPALLSLLYDIDLMPEQIRNPANAIRMVVICKIFSMLSESQIASLFRQDGPNDPP